jgi:protein-S-isoprenylcysteine O-methyltransferase Ste14
MKLFLFVSLSVPLVWLSRKSLVSLRHHGLYRLMSWESILFLFLDSYQSWFARPFNTNQIVSWILLIASLVLVIPGVVSMKKTGTQNRERADDSLFEFEKTTQLIETGIFGRVRHPLYGSLILLTWGIVFKNLSLTPLAVAALSTIFLVLTALVEEREDIEYFGERYVTYMKRTKMSVPFIL